jgi:hypothetical protein
MEVSGQLHTPATYPLGKSPRHPFYRRLGGSQSRSERWGEEKDLLLLLEILLLVRSLLHLLLLLDGRAAYPQHATPFSYLHGPLIRAPESFSLIVLSIGGPNNCVLLCGRRIFFSWITNGGMYTITHCYSSTVTAEPPQLVEFSATLH